MEIKPKSYLLFSFLIFIFSFSLYGQKEVQEILPFKKTHFQLKDSLDSTLTFSETVNEIEKICNSDIERISLIAGWIYNNISFDLDKFENGGNINTASTVFRERKGTCKDYAVLFSAFCNKMNITNEVIEGYSIGLDDSLPVFYETNHAWNTIFIEGHWYHCDLLSFTGKLTYGWRGNNYFIKAPDPSMLMTREMYFLGKHIPADPIWQLNNHPIPLDTLIRHGRKAKSDTLIPAIDYNQEIEKYVSLSEKNKNLEFAKHAHQYNPKNVNVMVVNYYNEAVKLINNANGDSKKLIQAERYLKISQKYIPHATSSLQVLKPQIKNGLSIIDRQLN